VSAGDMGSGFGVAVCLSGGYGLSYHRQPNGNRIVIKKASSFITGSFL
jgi:hypothetical protein